MTWRYATSHHIASHRITSHHIASRSRRIPPLVMLTGCVVCRVSCIVMGSRGSSRSQSLCADGTRRRSGTGSREGGSSVRRRSPLTIMSARATYNISPLHCLAVSFISFHNSGLFALDLGCVIASSVILVRVRSSRGGARGGMRNVRNRINTKRNRKCSKSIKMKCSYSDRAECINTKTRSQFQDKEGRSEW